MLQKENFIEYPPLNVIYCSKQNKSLKYGSGDIRLEFEYKPISVCVCVGGGGGGGVTLV